MSGPLNATFTYDAEGRRVTGVVDGTETIYLGDSYEKTGGADISYYHFNGRRLAMRTPDIGRSAALLRDIFENVVSTPRPSSCIWIEHLWRNG